MRDRTRQRIFDIRIKKKDCWGMQARHVERWLACARRAFAELDPDGDGVAQADDIVACLRAKLPPSEVPPFVICPPLTVNTWDDIVACLRVKLPPSEVPPSATRPPQTEGASIPAQS